MGWAEMLNLGDWTREVGVQIVDVRVSIPESGGVIDRGEIGEIGEMPAQEQDDRGRCTVIQSIKRVRCDGLSGLDDQDEQNVVYRAPSAMLWNSWWDDNPRFPVSDDPSAWFCELDFTDVRPTY